MMTPADIKDALEKMAHAVGYAQQKRRPALPYRNYYAANTGSREAKLWDVLCEFGLALKGRPATDDGQLVYYHVSEAGLVLLRKREIKRCKETR